MVTLDCRRDEDPNPTTRTSFWEVAEHRSSEGHFRGGVDPAWDGDLCDELPGVERRRCAVDDACIARKRRSFGGSRLREGGGKRDGGTFSSDVAS